MELAVGILIEVQTQRDRHDEGTLDQPGLTMLGPADRRVVRHPIRQRGFTVTEGEPSGAGLLEMYVKFVVKEGSEGGLDPGWWTRGYAAS